jgi:hypothetical protein
MVASALVRLESQFNLSNSIIALRVELRTPVQLNWAIAVIAIDELNLN